MIYNINNLYESNNNYLQTSTDTTTDEWKTSTWTNSGDDFFKSVDGKKVKLTALATGEGEIINYAEEKSSSKYKKERTQYYVLNNGKYIKICRFKLL